MAKTGAQKGGDLLITCTGNVRFHLFVIEEVVGLTIVSSAKQSHGTSMNGAGFDHFITSTWLLPRYGFSDAFLGIFYCRLVECYVGNMIVASCKGVLC
jgi:hypothetical protein